MLLDLQHNSHIKKYIYLEIYHPSRFSGRAVAVIRQRLPLPVKDEPPFVPVMELLAHF